MWEQTKAARRRYFDGAFHSIYFVGNGIDIGSGNDSLAAHKDTFPGIKTVRSWDVGDGDAQIMGSVADDSYDFVHSSHCLEHMRNPREALSNWLRILKPGGYMVITVPDEDLYELGHWPSRFNADHKWTFTIYKTQSWSPQSVNVLDISQEFGQKISIERVVLLRDFFREDLAAKNIDQTLGPNAECSIEFVWCKK